ncbi:MAG TPA: thermonuclease family protein [Caulobacteraceae bacterium]
MIAGALRFWKRAGAALALLAAACGGPDLDRLAEGERGRVALVRSGHTLVLEDGLVVRLAGVEAPAPDEPFGPEARERLEAVALGKDVRLLYGGARRDGYERALAHVRLVSGRRWVQGELLKSGAARVRTWPDNRALAAEMLRIEAGARLKERGLWAEPAYQVRLPKEAEAARGLTLVEGRVTAAEDGYSGVSLELGDALEVEVPGRALQDFRAAGVEPERLEGRLVRVRGWLRRARGAPAIRADHPEQIELLREP